MTERSLMKKLYRKFSQFIGVIFGLLPFWLNSVFGYIFAFIWVDILRLRKRIVYDNIELAFPGTTLEVKNKWMHQSLYVLCRSFFDVLKIPSMTDQFIHKHINFLGTENLKGLENSGVLFLSLHMASGDLGGVAFSKKVKPLSLISKQFKNNFLNEFWFSMRTKSESEFIEAHGKNTAFDILKALKRNRGVVFVIDQFMGKPYGIETTFFGHKTGTAYGLALFALKTKAPVLPLSTFWGADGKLNLQVGPVIDFSDIITDDKEMNHLKMTQRCNQVIEDIIRKNPDQWMWVHRRWKVFE